MGTVPGVPGTKTFSFAFFSLQLATSMEQTRPTGDTKNLGIQLAAHPLLMLVLSLHCRLTGSESLCKFGSVPRDLDVPVPPSCLHKHG